jgi:ribosomal protein S12 methylthiotransferase
MRRPGHQEKTLERIKAWRAECPELTIRSTFIVGFPGETEEDFEFLLEWMQEAKIDRAGCFKYEPVAGATSNALPDHVPPEVQQERWERFMEVQRQVSEERQQAKIGKTIDVIIDEVDGEGGADARSKADAPEIDGTVFLKDVPSSMKPGDIVSIKVEDADDYDLFGAPVLSGV